MWLLCSSLPEGTNILLGLSLVTTFCDRLYNLFASNSDWNALTTSLVNPEIKTNRIFLFSVLVKNKKNMKKISFMKVLIQIITIIT